MEDGLDTTRAAVEAHVDGAVLSGLIVDLAARMIVVRLVVVVVVVAVGSRSCSRHRHRHRTNAQAELSYQ